MVRLAAAASHWEPSLDWNHSAAHLKENVGENMFQTLDFNHTSSVDVDSPN